MATPWDLLLKPAGDCPPIYDKATDLAADLLATGYEGHKGLQSLMASLSGILHARRPCPRDLSERIVTCAMKRAEARGRCHSERLCESLRESLQQRSAAAPSNRREFAALLRALKEAKSIIVMAPNAVLSAPCGQEVFAEILSKMRKASGNPNGKFVFVCSSQQAAKDLWRDLLIPWKSEFPSPSVAIEDLQEREALGTLAVLAVDEAYCVYSAILTDPEEARAWGAHIEVFDEQRAAAYPMSHQSLVAWKRCVYTKIMLGAIGERVTSGIAFPNATESATSDK